MRKNTPCFTLLGLLAISTSTLAMQRTLPESYRYRWHDDNGQLHFSDNPNSQAIKNGYDVLNNTGLVVHHVPRQLTAEESKAATARKAKAEAAAVQHAQDMQILDAYPDERAFRNMQQAKVDKLAQALHTIQVNLHTQEKNLADLLAHVADIKHRDQPVPAFLTQRINQQRNAVTQQRAKLIRQQQAKIDAEKLAKQRLARYQQLHAEKDASSL